MQALSEKQVTIDQTEIDGRVYVNALTPDSSTHCALMLLCCHRQTGEEKLIDALLPDDRLATVLSVIRQTLGSSWTLQESWEIEPFTVVV